MKIADLQPKQQKVDIEVEVISKEEPKDFDKFGRQIRVANAMVKDDSGQIKLTLWNDDIEKVNVGDKVKVTNGYVNEYQGEKQLTSGKFGKLEVISSSESSEEQPSEEEPSDEEVTEEQPSEEEPSEEEVTEEKHTEDS